MAAIKGSLPSTHHSLSLCQTGRRGVVWPKGPRGNLPSLGAGQKLLGPHLGNACSQAKCNYRPPARAPATSPLPGGLVERGLAPDPPRSRSPGALQWRPEGPGLENTCTERPHRWDVPRHAKDQPHSTCSRRTGPYPAGQTALCWQESLSLRHGHHLPWKRPC